MCRRTALRARARLETEPGSVVAALWQQPNARGLPDPAIASRVTGPACVIHIAIAPNYPSVGVAG